MSLPGKQPHAIERAKERVGLILVKEDLIDLREQIVARLAILTRVYPDGKQGWLTMHQGVAYSASRGGAACDLRP